MKTISSNSLRQISLDNFGKLTEATNIDVAWNSKRGTPFVVANNGKFYLCQKDIDVDKPVVWIVDGENYDRACLLNSNIDISTTIKRYKESKITSVDKTYFKASLGNNYDIITGFNKNAYDQIIRAVEGVGISLMCYRSNVKQSQTYLIKQKKYLSVDIELFRHVKKDSCTIQFSCPYDFESVRVWTKNENNKSVWSTPELIETCTEPEFLFKFFIKDWDWFKQIIQKVKRGDSIKQYLSSNNEKSESDFYYSLSAVDATPSSIVQPYFSE